MLSEKEIEDCNRLMLALDSIWTVSRSLDQKDVRSVLQIMVLNTTAVDIAQMVQVRVREALNVPDDVMVGLTHYEAVGITVPERVAKDMVEVTTAIANGELDDLI